MITAESTTNRINLSAKWREPKDSLHRRLRAIRLADEIIEPSAKRAQKLHVQRTDKHGPADTETSEIAPLFRPEDRKPHAPAHSES